MIGLTVKRLAAAVLVMSLGGCGFAPVYGDHAGAFQAQDALDRVQIAPIGGRMLGLNVRNELLDRLNPNGEPTSPAYRLEVTLVQGGAGSLVQPDASITRYNYTLTAKYSLIGLEDDKVLTAGSVFSRTAYNVVDSEYATLVGREDAQKRAASAVGEDLALRIALYFNGRAS